MNNKKIYVVLIMLAVVLSGCSKTKKMSCKQKNDIMSTEIITTFKKNNLDSMKVIYRYDISDYSDSNKEDIKNKNYCEIIEKSENDYKGNFKDCKQVIGENEIIVTTNIDITKQKENGITSYENLKKELEAANNKCEDL